MILREVLPAQPSQLHRALLYVLGWLVIALFSLAFLGLFTWAISPVRIRTHAAQCLANTFASVIPLERPPTVIDAPPSQLAEYSALAVWLEHAEIHATQDDDVLVNVATLEASNIVVPVEMPGLGWALVDGTSTQTLTPGVTVSMIGSLRCSGRIWSGSRYAAKREELEEAVTIQFFQNRAAPGRIMVDLKTCDVAGYTIPFGWGAATINTSQWAGEHSFEARLWSWIAFDLDVPILIPRTDPIASTLLLNITMDVAQGSWNPSVDGANQVLVGPQQDQYKITTDEDGEADATLENPPI